MVLLLDPTPVGWRRQHFEQATETARILQRQYEAAKARMVEAMTTLYWGQDDADPDRMGANAIARHVAGIMSRPTVLKTIDAIDADELDQAREPQR